MTLNKDYKTLNSYVLKLQRNDTFKWTFQIKGLTEISTGKCHLIVFQRSSGQSPIRRKWTYLSF